MGMAASQARYLGLTARKTNVEYEGQQINQARTALGNQSATLWNQQLSLSIPTCPNMTDYTTVQYAFSDGYNTYEISTLQSVDYTDPKTGIKYNTQVTYRYNQDVYKAVQAKNTNPQVQIVHKNATKTENAVGDIGSLILRGTGDNRKFKMLVDDGAGGVKEEVVTPKKIDKGTDEYRSYLAANGLTELATGEFLYACTLGDKTVYVTSTKDMTVPTKFNTGDTFPTQNITPIPTYFVGNSEATLYDPTDKAQKAAMDQIRHDFPDEKIAAAPDGKIWTYQKNGQVYFATEEELIECMNSVTKKPDDLKISSGIDYQSPLNQYYTGTIKQEIVNTDYALMDDASGSGRYSSIKLSTMSETFKVEAEEVSDEKAYNDAMNQYNYDVTCYEKAMADINAKTKIIQEQDRQLELRLKQLDTEQKALSTEMDAVKGIIQKNVESTFKTFS